MYILYINYVLVKYWIYIYICIIGKIYIVYVLYKYMVCKLWVSKEFKIFLILLLILNYKIEENIMVLCWVLKKYFVIVMLV